MDETGVVQQLNGTPDDVDEERAQHGAYEQPVLKTVQVRLKGTAALLMHNDRLSNPFDPITQAIARITGKGKKQTEADRNEALRLEWEGGLYFRPKLGPYIPGANLKKCMNESAKVFRGGRDVIRGLTPLDAEIPLLYAGPRDIEGLWNAGYYDIRPVKVSGRVLRARPCFRDWGLETTWIINTTVIDLDDVRHFLEQGGLMTGLGDYRPTFGRFIAELTVLA